MTTQAPAMNFAQKTVSLSSGTTIVNNALTNGTGVKALSFSFPSAIIGAFTTPRPPPGSATATAPPTAAT
ncbi:MAG: hypothetical protein WDN45_19235 [Caulobacteraceae bacterium]